MISNVELFRTLSLEDKDKVMELLLEKLQLEIVSRAGYGVLEIELRHEDERVK